MVMSYEPVIPEELPWRVGGKVGRTIYAVTVPGDQLGDVLIGMMDTRELAALVVDEHNAALEHDEIAAVRHDEGTP